MTKEELKLTIFEEYIGYNKLVGLKKLKEIIECDLRRGKELIDFIFNTSDFNINIHIFISDFNIMWNNLTKEEKNKVKKYDNIN